MQLVSCSCRMSPQIEQISHHHLSPPCWHGRQPRQETKQGYVVITCWADMDALGRGAQSSTLSIDK
eukprot:5583091-Amphidinium_carterae.1